MSTPMLRVSQFRSVLLSVYQPLSDNCRTLVEHSPGSPKYITITRIVFSPSAITGISFGSAVRSFHI